MDLITLLGTVAAIVVAVFFSAKLTHLRRVNKNFAEIFLAFLLMLFIVEIGTIIVDYEMINKFFIPNLIIAGAAWLMHFCISKPKK